ncbi:nitroreductase family protein [Deferrisoma camini]|uniref:nitroreductase family protein n=1 Tax=Deferrisoma camini TaxID=1035120 RepID=UPI00046D83B5|nr:nitroreductase family protein [Deferrisoma camini]
MELYEAIRGRRSIRRYKPDPVPQEVLDRLLEAAQWAPSWAHTQCCEVVVVSDPQVKEALQKTLPPSNPAFRAMVEAPLSVAFCAKTGRAGFYKGKAATPRGDWFMFDVALAMENFMLAAHAEGLGTVCVGLFDAAAAAKAVGAPEGVEVVALTPLGYPAAEAKVPPRKPRDEFVRWNRYAAD